MGIAANFSNEWEEYRAKLQKELPQLMAAFIDLSNAAYQDGVLSRETKELIALGIAISMPCEACIAHHTSGALQAGATKEQIMEAVGVAIQMRGGPAAGEGGRKVLKILEELMGEK